MQQLHLKKDKEPLQLGLQVTKRVTVSSCAQTNYSRKEINDLFDVGLFGRIVGYKSKAAKRLFDLGLKYEESKYLLKINNFSVDEIVMCIKDFNLKFDLIEKLIDELNCSKYTLLTEVPILIKQVGGSDKFKLLVGRNLSIPNIKTLFNDLKLNYESIISLLDCEFKVCEIEQLMKAKYSCEELVSLAQIITAKDVWSLYQSDKQNLKFLLSVKSILKKDISSLSIATECFQSIYLNIPTSLCTSLVNIAVKIRSERPDNNSKDSSGNYEDILKYYMDLAGGIPLTVLSGLETVPKVFSFVEWIISKRNPSYVKFIEEYIPVKPFILAAIWLALDVSLEKQYLKKTENINFEVISRSILSFLISSMCGVTGYFHSGGVGLPFPNVTSYIKSYYDTQNLVKKFAPRLYNKIPKCLLFETPEAFENLTKDKQISAGRGLSMLYTFRVGNAFLCALLGDRVITEESAKNIFKSLWPLPQEAESIRMYFIYSGIPIYTTLPLKDVFVEIK